MITFDLTIVICDRAVLIVNDNESDFISVEKIKKLFEIQDLMKENSMFENTFNAITIH